MGCLARGLLIPILLAGALISENCPSGRKGGKKDMKSKYICSNCRAGQDRKYVDAMRKAGFGLHHLACKMCGQQTIKEQS